MNHSDENRRGMTGQQFSYWDEMKVIFICGIVFLLTDVLTPSYLPGTYCHVSLKDTSTPLWFYFQNFFGLVLRGSVCVFEILILYLICVHEYVSFGKHWAVITTPLPESLLASWGRITMVMLATSACSLQVWWTFWLLFTSVEVTWLQLLGNMVHRQTRCVMLCHVMLCQKMLKLAIC